MENSTEREYLQCAIRTDNAPSLVREESCFPMVELGEALDIVDGEVRTALHIRLREVSYSRTSQVNIPVCGKGDISQPTQKSKYYIQRRHFPGEDFVEHATRAFHFAAGEGTTEDPNRHHLVADSAGTEHCLVETIGPPFLGRRVGSPNGVSAPFALPPFRASLVDGYALHVPLNKWREVRQVYKTTSPQQSVELNAGHNGEDRVALKITGEVRAGADLTRESLQPFRGHPHIWEKIRRERPNESRTRCSLKNRTEYTERVDEARTEEVPITPKCVYVTTGSPVPTWCNAVVPVESCEVDIDNCLCWPDHEALSNITGDGYNIREVGSDAQAKSLLLQQGQLVGPAEEGILAAVGLERLEVFRKLNVHTLALGDELRSRGAAGTLKKEVVRTGAPQSECGCSRDGGHDSSICGDNDGDVESQKMQRNSMAATPETQTTSAAVYDSNSPMLQALLSQHCPSTYVGQHHVLPDDVDEVQRLLLALALKEPTLPRYVTRPVQRRSHWAGDSERALQGSCADVLVSTGGVSMGGSDCMKLALLRLQRKTLQQHPDLQINARCRGHFAQQKRQRGSAYAETASVTTSNSGDRTDVLTGTRENTRGVPSDTGKKTIIASISDTEPPAARDWSHTVETEIKFGRLNVKPGKPAMFAILRVFPRHSVGNELDAVEEAKQPLLFEEIVDGATTQQAKSTDDTLRGIGHISRCELFEKFGSSSESAYSDVEHPFLSSAKLPSQRQKRRPVRVLLVFALPGNPCSAWVLFHLLVAPALNVYSSFCPSTSISTHVPAQILAILDEPIIPDSARPEYHRALVYVRHSESKTGSSGSDGRSSAQESQSSVSDWTASAHAAHHLYAFPTGIQTSSRLLSCCASANGLILVTPSKVSKRLCIPAGETVPVLLCGAPFPVRPRSLIDLVKVQNKLNGFYKTGCRCGGGRESSEDELSPKIKNALSINELITRRDEATDETSSFNLTSVSSLTDLSGISASHFKHSQSVSETVNLGIVIVSDRCYSGDMQDACADTLLGVLQQSSAIAALLQLRSQRERNSKSSMRAEDDKISADGQARDTSEKQSGQIRIVPDQIESIQEAVLSMLCTCAENPEMLLRTDADRSLPPRSLIFVCGGTGLSPRDVTPQALLPLFTLRCSGIEHLLLEYSLRCTPLAALGRPCAGVIECGAGLQMRLVKIHGTNSVTSTGMCERAIDKRKYAQAPVAVRSPFEECCTRTVSHSSKKPQGFESVMIDECCCHSEAYALQKFKDRKCTTREDVPPFGKCITVTRELPGSTAAPPESATAGALGTVAGGTVKVSRQRSGCGARCMVVVFPGSPKAVKENATALLPVLPHALEQL